MHSPQSIIPEDLEQRIVKVTELHHIVADWIENYRPAQDESTYRYKFNLENILPLPDEFLHHFIEYVTYVKFPFVLEDLNVEEKMKKNLFLKTAYQQEFYHGKWKKEFCFEFAMVFLVKTTTKFIAYYFPSLKINQNLQSQLYIILHNVLIGNQIGTKIFHIVSKKYLKPPLPKTIPSPYKASISLNKKDSFISVYKPSTKLIEPQHTESPINTKQKILFGKENASPPFPQNVNPRKNNYRNKISFLKTETVHQKSNIEIFGDQLKKNLYVAPLPILEPKKMDISQYEHSKYGSLEPKDKKILGEAYIKPVNLRTTKITCSMDTLMSVNYPTLSTHEQNKPGNILLSRQLSSKHYCLTSCSIYNEVNDKSYADNLDKDMKSKHNNSKHPGKMSYEEWNQLLGKIRLNIKNSAIFERQTPVINRSYDSINHNQSMNDLSYDRTSHKDEKRDFKIKGPKEPIMNRMATEHCPNSSTTKNNNNDTKSLDRTFTQDSIFEETPYSKLNKFSTTVDTESHLSSQAHASEDNYSLFKKEPSNSHQKLSKTSKLKLAKLTFLSECKKREKKLTDAGHGGDIKMSLY